MKILSDADFSSRANDAANAAAVTWRLRSTLSPACALDTSRHEFSSTVLMGCLCETRQTKLKKNAERMRPRAAKIEAQFPNGGRIKSAMDSDPRLIVVSPRAGVIVDRMDVEKRNCEAAELPEAELICVSTRSRSPTATTLLGSMPQAVVARSPRPALLVFLPASGKQAGKNRTDRIAL